MAITLSDLRSPMELHELSHAELAGLADEIRDCLCNLLAKRPAHFASNLGVVELTLALHSVFDFRRDRLIWDTGHQIYPHKLVTGRRDRFESIRTRGGLMGYPNPAESEYDLFVTGHAGCSVSTMLGLRSGDDLMGQEDRKAVAVIGDGALPSGIVFEALNNAGELKANLLVILNDNKMSICPRVGGVARYLDRLRANPFYSGLKSEVVNVLNKVPVFGDPAERFLAQLKEGVKAGLHGGMMFEELGFQYLGPIDGHNLPVLRKYLKMVKEMKGPVLLHVLTEKGHGFRPAASDPVFFHTPPVFDRDGDEAIIRRKSSVKSYTAHAADAILELMRHDERVTVLTAAMCQGNQLEEVRDAFPTRFFDVGICESHAVAFAAGQAKAGMRPIVDIYSTFLQRSYDQIFQEVSLQKLPVTFMMDRAGLTGPDGPTHHGTFDIGYLRIFPHLVVMAPGDANDLGAMLEFAVRHDAPCAIRYPKENAADLQRELRPIEVGKSEVMTEGDAGAIVCFGAMLAPALEAARRFEEQEGGKLTVVNARFAKPLDETLLHRLIRTLPFVVTVEEGNLQGGFGSAVLESANDARIDASRVRRLGLPDRYVEHGERGELLADLGLDADGILAACREAAGRAAGLPHVTA
ncbi:MAG TPA: 1-deoxy-D-xylulose-5-phosphate synthase [Pirellulaceae bacterium]|nr:1-deoxy-D-xylulose-5-phosphate synthase [Pirellulaceae bacterium]